MPGLIVTGAVLAAADLHGEQGVQVNLLTLSRWQFAITVMFHMTFRRSRLAHRSCCAFCKVHGIWQSCDWTAWL
jgi:hypothetical protein